LAALDDVGLNGHPEQTVPGILNLAFAGVDGETLLLALRDLAVSSGSACTSATMEPSFVLRGIGLSDELAQSSLRISIGRFTTAEEIDKAVTSLVTTVRNLRQRTLAWICRKAKIFGVFSFPGR
jgi:cysteine desulfurase